MSVGRRVERQDVQRDARDARDRADPTRAKSGAQRECSRCASQRSARAFSETGGCATAGLSSGGVAGRQIRLTSLDDELKPDRAIANYEKLLDQNALVLRAYLEAYQVFGKEALKKRLGLELIGPERAVRTICTLDALDEGRPPRITGEAVLVRELIEGVINLALVVAYIYAISRIPDIQRVFGYHGAEHKVINAYEAGARSTGHETRRIDVTTQTDVPAYQVTPPSANEAPASGGQRTGSGGKTSWRMFNF